MSRIPPSFDEPNVAMPLCAPMWYAVRTNTRCEQRAVASIRDALRPRNEWGDLAVWLPVETYFAMHARKQEMRTRPLLIGYVFLCIREEDMHVVRLCDGVRDFVRGPGGMPSRLVLSEVLKLRKREEAGEFDSTRQEDFGGLFVPDEKVKVAVGAYADWPGRVVKMTSAEKVKVILSMFGKEHEKEFRVTDLKAA